MASSSSSSSTDLFVADYPVGVESRVQDVIQLLKLNTQILEEPIIIVIWGVGGSGKTTIAKAVYNKIHHHFEAKSFLLNVRNVWQQDNGEVSLQQQLLSDIYKTTDIKKIETVESGKIILQEMLPQKRIVLVLDSVNKLDQLDALCGSRKWFGQGSIIIITSRDKQVLRSFGVEHAYEMKQLNIYESLELFSWYAFNQPNPIEDFADLSTDVVEYSGGSPLALQIIGSFYFTRRRKEERKSVIEKLKHAPHRNFFEVIKLCFDDLSDNDVQNIFLDIASNLVGMDHDDVIKILKDSGHSAENGIRVLVQRRLVTVDSKNRIGMHDSLQIFGREMIRQGSASEVRYDSLDST